MFPGKIWGVMQERMYKKKICDVDELIAYWNVWSLCNFYEQNKMMMMITTKKPHGVVWLSLLMSMQHIITKQLQVRYKTKKSHISLTRRSSFPNDI